MKNNIFIPKNEGTYLENNILDSRLKLKSPIKQLNSTRKMKSSETSSNINNFTKVPYILLSNTNHNSNKTTNSQINLFHQQVPSINVSLSQNLKLQMKDSNREGSEVLTQTMRSQRKKQQVKTEGEENYIKINIYNSNTKIDNTSSNKNKNVNNKVSLTAKKANRLYKNTQYINNTIILKGVQPSSLSKIKSQSVINDKHINESSKNNDKNLKSYVSFSVNSKSINDISLENINGNNKNNPSDKVYNSNNIILDFINNNKSNINNINLLNKDYQSNFVSNSEIQLSLHDNKNDVKNLKFSEIDKHKTLLFDKSQRSFSARNINCAQTNQKKGLLVPTVKTNLYEEETKNSNENTIINSEGSCKYRKVPMIKTLSEARYNRIINRSYSSEENTLKTPSSSKEIIETFVNKLKMIKENYNSSEQKVTILTTNPVINGGNTNCDDVTVLPEILIKESNKDINFEIMYDIKSERFYIVNF